MTDPAAAEELGILFARNPVPMWVFDPATLRILAVNQAAERQYGWSADEFVRLTLADLRPPEEMERLHAAVRRAAADPSAVVGRGEARHRRRDGTLLEVEVTTQDIVFRGAPARVAVAVDITGRFRAARRLEALQAVTARLATALTAGEVADAVVSEGVRVLGAHSGSVALLDPARDEVEVVGAVGYSREALERFRRVPLDTGFPLTDAVRDAGPVFLADAEARDARYPHLAELRRSNGGGAMAAVPLMLDGQAIGAIGLNFPEDVALGEDERAFVLALARQCAQALHRARLYEEERHSRVAAERLQALTEGFSGALTVAQVGEVAMRQGVAALGAWAGVLALRTPAGDEVELLASLGYPEAACMSAGRRWRADAEIPIARATRTGEPVFLESPDAWAAHFRTGHTPASGVSQAWAAVPLALEDGTPGALLWTYDRPHRFGAPEQALMLSISRLCAQAMDRARLFEAERSARAERDRALALAEDARDRLRLVFEQAPVSIVVLRGPEHVVESANEAYMAVLGRGRRPAELLGLPVRRAIPELDGQGFYELLDAVYATGEPYVGTEVPARIDRDGDGVEEELLYNFVYQPLFGVDGAVEGICAVGVDVTELSLARRAAEEANLAKSQFLATMSHELRTPLNAIGGYAQLLEMGIFGPVTEAQREHLSRIQFSQEHLLGLINNVLNFARIEAGRVQYVAEEVPLAEALRGITELILPQARERGVCLHPVECPPEPRVRADPEKFRQVVLNLLSNAVKFTPAGGSVTVSAAARDDGLAAVRVADTGVGIAPERIGEIFDPFVQVGRHLSSRDEGVGLGLSISRDLARGMGGDLTAESVLGHGATFTLTLPLAQSAQS